MLRRMTSLRCVTLLFLIGCAGASTSVAQPVAPPTAAVPAASCDTRQADILREADARATPWSTAQHLAKNFPDGRVAWLMKDASYQSFVVKTAAPKWGRCNDTGCYVFAAPATVIHAAVERSMVDGHHDPAALGKALGLPAASFDGPLRLMTLDLHKVGACARLPVDADPGVWPCKSAEDTDCFKFGGYTSGGIPELMVIDAPVAQTTVEEVP
jgi:hypothetical protein